MKKSDLRTGMVVTCRNGNKYMVFLNAAVNTCHGCNYLAREEGIVGINEYNEDLTNRLNSNFDIMTVEPVCRGEDLAKSIKRANTIFGWRRNEKKKMTVAEIEKALGYGVEIVSEG